MRAARRSLSASARSRAAHRLARELARTSWFLRSQRIACYLANDGEMDPAPLMERAWRQGKTCYLPVLSPISGDRLWFAAYRPGDPLATNRFGIPEPVYQEERPVPAWALDLVLTPLVAFDPQGNRLGMGGGYYDRTFAYLGGRQRWRKPVLVGLAYDLQKVEALPCAPWDVPLAGVVTEQRCYRSAVVPCAGPGTPI
jgi:5-formyltetrahydrofolate cyclo-ligase